MQRGNILNKELARIAKTAPLNGYIESGNFSVAKLKEKYNKSDYYVVEVLESLLSKGEIRDLYVNCDVCDGHILSYKFR